MSFDLHIVAKTQDLPATISLRNRKIGVACYLSVKLAVLKAIGATEKSLFDVLIGSAEDAGKLRLRANKDGRAAGRKMRDYLIFNLGSVAAFPAHEVDKQRCDAKPVDGTTLEIALPDWTALAPVDEDEAHIPLSGGTPRLGGLVASRPVVPAGRPATAELSRNGITIDLTHDEESISFRKKTMDISTRQAAVAAALLRAMPSNVGREWLCKNVLTDIAAATRDVSLDLIFRDLAKACSAVGLELKITPKIGAMLVIA